MIKIDVHGEDGSDNNDCFDYEGGDFSDPDVDEVPDDIDEEGTKDENVYAPLVENSSWGIIIHNDPKAHILNIDHHAAHASEYPDIIPAHLMLANPKSKELFVGQRFASKDDCVATIKWYSMKVSIDYKMVYSKLTIYVGKYWRSVEGCKWRVWNISS